MSDPLSAFVARPRRDPPSVLILEPHAALRSRLASMLSESPCCAAVTAVAQLSEALDPLRHSRFDAVVVELDLQGPEGLQALSALRGLAPGAARIALTGSADLSLDAVGVELGADHCIHTLTEFERVRDIVMDLSASTTEARSDA